MVTEVKIGDRIVGQGQPCFIIAEAGVNHNGVFEKAKKLVDAAVLAGADAVKFQTFNANEIVSSAAQKANYQLETTSESESQLEMLQRLQLSEKDHISLQDYCKDKNILFLSTPFDLKSANFLETLEIPAYKIGSSEITNLPLLEHVARKGKPIILSTGMSYLSEVDEAIRLIRNSGNEQIILLHCVSNYPADPSDINLNAISTMVHAFGVPVGYSDHALGIEISLAARAIGACVVEKHLTLDRNSPGPDHLSSLEPDEFGAMVKSVRNIEAALGHGRKIPAESEANTSLVARKSLVAESDISMGTKLTPELIRIKRPGHGIPPALLPYVLGRTLRKNVAAGTVITLEMLS